MSCNDSIIVPGATNVLSIGDPLDPQSTTAGLHDSLTGLPVNDATCTVESIIDLYTKVAVTGWTLPAAMAYLSGSRGVYTVETPVGLAVVKGQQIKVGFKGIRSGKVTLFSKVYTVAEEGGI